MPKKKIVHLIRTLEVGGCEIALLRMLPLTNDTFENSIITLQQKGLLAPRFKNEGIPVIALEQHGFFDILSYVRLGKILKKIHPDLVVTHLLHADVVGRFYVQYIVQCKVVSSIVTTYNFHRYWAARLFERATKRLATNYMANSNSVKETYIKKFGVRKEKITVVPRGIDIDPLTIRRHDPSLARNIICVANLHPNKGHMYLLEAFEKIFQVHSNIKLLLVGEGNEKEKLLLQISGYQSKQAILFLGKCDDVIKLLQTSYVFVLPTFFEGMSNAIMEAMARGLPVITSDIPENRELITHGQTGLLCPVQNSDCLVEMIGHIMNNESLARRLGKNGNLEMRKKYNLQVTSELWKSYFSLMSQS